MEVTIYLHQVLPDPGFEPYPPPYKTSPPSIIIPGPDNPYP